PGAAGRHRRVRGSVRGWRPRRLSDGVWGKPSLYRGGRAGRRIEAGGPEHGSYRGGGERGNSHFTGNLIRAKGVFPVLPPPITGDQRVVLVGQPVAGAPVVELARSDPQPGDELSDRDLGALRPPRDVIDDGVADVVGNPGPGQSPPRVFF